jgi:hypothetical protein
MKIRPLSLGITLSVSLILLIFTTPVNHSSVSLPQTGVQIARDGSPLPPPDPPGCEQVVPETAGGNSALA